MFSVATVVAAHALSSQPAPSDWLGTWAYEKDGFAFTAIFESDMDGAMVTRRLVLDENNREIARSIYTRDPVGRWRETFFNRQGDRATFEQRGNSDDSLSLEMTAFNGTPEPVVQARTLHTPMPDGTLVVDWQSRAIDGGFTPRAVPYTYGRVDRPVAPTGDGRIAFISTRDGNWEIYTVNPDGTDLRNLTNSPATDHAPHWMAGGTRLSFRSTRETPDYELPEERGGWARWEIDADGTDAVLADMLIRGHSADFGTFPAVSPDGSYIAYTTERDGELDLFVSRFDGGGERRLGSAPGPDYRPSWSPDGREILFISERDGGDQEIYKVGFSIQTDDIAEPIRLTDSPGADRYARWSPDGTHIAFASARVHGEQGLDLFVMHADGSGLRQLTDSTAEDGEISWSPDSTRLAFRRTTRSGDESQAEVMIINLATGVLTNLSNNPAYDGEPVWSP